ncbi:cache domain-containing protein, partial [Candidatus Desantisbacteria bacterium]|nr:cache domain-containing protein [Candidatus Desantisbacteria bacterium]
MKINKIVIVLLIIFSLQCAVFSSEIKQANGEKLINKSDEIINSLREKLKEKSNDLLVLADMLKTYSQGGKEVWNKNIISFSEEMKEYGVIRLIDRRGREIIKVVNGIKTEDLKDESTKDYFKTAMKSKVGQVYISPVLISDIFQKPIIRFATPLVNLAEINKAVLEFDMDLDEIINMINSVKIGISGNSYLISLDGTFITNKEKNRIMRENINKNAGPGFEGIFKKMSNFEKGWGECVYNKESCSIGYAPFQEMGWIAVVIIPRQEFEQNELEIKNISASSVYAGEDSQKLSVKSSEQNLSVVSSSTIDTQEAISSTTLKLLDGSLRTKNIDSYKAILTFTKKMADNSFYNFKINIMAKEASGSDYTAFFQRNRNRITGLFELDESVYRKIKFEIVSPSLLKKSKIINQNLVMMYLPVKNEIIRMNRDELGEYESIFEDKEKKYLNSYTSVELKEFTNDRFDIKIDE